MDGDSQLINKNMELDDKIIELEKYKEKQKTIRCLGIVIGIILIVFILQSHLSFPFHLHSPSPSSSSKPSSQNLFEPEAFGHTLYKINTPLNSSQLAIINNASQQYFDIASQMILNGSLKIPLFVNINGTPYELYGKQLIAISSITNVPLRKEIVHAFMGNVTPFIYLGSTTCFFCGETRLALELALSRFGHFNELYYGYSAFGDGDLPTFFFDKVPYNASGLDDVRNYYVSKNITFVSIEDINPLTGGFVLNPLSVISQNVNSIYNGSRSSVNIINGMDLILNLSSNRTTTFVGTPYVIAGDYLFEGSDGINLGLNGTTVNGQPIGTYLQDLTHEQVLKLIAHPNTQLAWGYYAMADLYISAICKSINNTLPACTSQIQALEKYI